MARLLAFASAAAVTLSVLSAQADPLPDDPLAVTRGMKAMVGKRFFIADSAAAGIELCPSASDRFKECRRLTEATFIVEGTAASGVTFPFFRVTLDGGEKGFISGRFADRFHPAGLSGVTFTNCDRDGPVIGVTAAYVRKCWGAPNRINTTKTADGTDEQWVYRAQRAYVYLRGGIVTAVQTTR